MAHKHTLFFEARTNASGEQDGARVGGWSESYYADSRYANGGDPFDKLMHARAALLPSTSFIKGWRISDTTKQTAGIVRNKVIKGTWQEQADFPSLALLCRGVSESGNRLQLILRGLPDVATQEGEYSPKTDTWKRFVAFRQHLPNFYQICRKLNAPQRNILAISADGVVLLAEELAGNTVGTKVWIQRTKVDKKGSYNGLYTITARTSGLTFTIGGWMGGIAQGGVVRLAQTANAVYPATMAIERVIHKKVGRPIFSFVGRR